MSNADKIDVAYVARLARLYLTDEEQAEFQGQLEQVVEYVRKIGDLDLEGIEPTSHAHLVQNVLRPDETRPGLGHEQVMKNAPADTDGQFKVPRIIE